MVEGERCEEGGGKEGWFGGMSGWSCEEWVGRKGGGSCEWQGEGEN